MPPSESEDDDAETGSGNKIMMISDSESENKSLSEWDNMDILSQSEAESLKVQNTVVSVKAKGAKKKMKDNKRAFRKEVMEK